MIGVYVDLRTTRLRYIRLVRMTNDYGVLPYLFLSLFSAFRAYLLAVVSSAEHVRDDVESHGEHPSHRGVLVKIRKSDEVTVNCNFITFLITKTK